MPLFLRKIDKRSPYAKFCDRFFIFLLLSLPFERAFLSGGEGAFLQYLVVAFVLFSLPLFRRYYAKWCPALVAYFIFLLVGSFSDVRAWGSFSFQFIWVELRIWVVFFFLVVSYNLARRNDYYIRGMIYALLIFALIVSVFQVSGIGVTEGYERGIEGSRMMVLGENVNFTARNIDFFLIFCFLLFVQNIPLTFWKKILMYFLSAVAFYALLRTGSRGGLLAIAMALPFVLFTTKSITKKFVCIILLSVAVVGMGFAIMCNPTARERILKSYYDRDTGGREDIFYLTIELWKESKMLGYGHFGYTFEIGSHLPGQQGKEKRLASHSTYTHAYMAGGVFGAIFYYAALLLILRHAIRIRHRPYGNLLFLGLLMLLFGALAMNIETCKWIYVLYGCILGADEVRLREKYTDPRYILLT